MSPEHDEPRTTLLEPAVPAPRISEWMRDVPGAASSWTPETTRVDVPWAVLESPDDPHLPQLHRLRRLSSWALRVSVVLIVLYGLLFNFSVVRGSSMSPSIFDGDRILIDHLSYMFLDVHRGDIVVLQYPLDPRLDYIKRVIGLPGDEVVIEAGRVFVNGIELEEEYVDVPDLQSRLHTLVDEESYFVLGDNRCHSSDSREFGLVPARNLRGKVDLRVWPLGRFGLID